MAVIGFIGLGNMGFPMALRLHAAGHDVRGFDPNASIQQRALDCGLKPQSSAADAVRDAEVVIAMLPTGKHVLEALTASDLPYRAGCLVVDCSTIDVESSREFHERLARLGLATLDAPVSGGTTGAAAGTLTLMVGGLQETFDKALHVLQPMARNIFHAGSAGAGQAAKICNNMILGISMIAVSEGMQLAKHMGLDVRRFFEIASVSSGQCWAMTTYSPEPGLVPNAPSSHGYEGGFASELMLKDLRLAEHAGITAGSPLLLGSAAASLFAMHCAAGRGRLDFSSIIKMLQSLSEDSTAS